jgi:DNA invertase Pin-like site-specific DNA recombinase
VATYGYTRVSTAAQTDGTSLDEQRKRTEGVAQVCGLQLERVFSDEAVSGSVALDDRPAGRELVKVLRAGDTVVVAKLDRAFRDASDALTRADAWKRAGVKLILCDLGCDPVNNGSGVSRMMFGMLALFAEFERARIAERIEPDAAEQAALETIRGLCGSHSLRAIVSAVREQHGLNVSYETVRRICRQLQQEGA